MSDNLFVKTLVMSQDCKCLNKKDERRTIHMNVEFGLQA